jgi:hypothetical protein
MKRFVKYILGFLLAALLLMALLDVGYTYVYNHSTPRTKVQMLKQAANTKIDYVFLGSSRVDNSIVPEIIEQKTGKKAMNFGFQASKLEDIYTVLKLLKEYNISSEKVFIQIDYNYNIDGRSIQLPYEIVPFIRDNAATKQYFESSPDFGQLYYIPFYRYCAFDHKVGLREMLFNVAGKKTNVMKNRGYSALFGSAMDSAYALPEKIRKHNTTFDDIRKYCADNKINAVFYCAPFWKGSKNLDYISALQNKILDLKNYSGVVTERSMFNNNAHLNDKGARYFTSLLADELLPETKKPL